MTTNWKKVLAFICTIRGKHTPMKPDVVGKVYCRICGVEKVVEAPKPADPSNPDPKPDVPVQPNGAPAWASVKVAQPGKSDHMGDYAETVKLASCTMRPGLIQWVYADDSAMDRWSEVTMNVPVCGCFFFLVQRDGEWWQVVTEWVKRGGDQNRLAEACLAVRHNGKRIFDDHFQPRNGETIWFGVASLNYYGVRGNVKERSNLVPVTVAGMPNVKEPEPEKPEPVKQEPRFDREGATELKARHKQNGDKLQVWFMVEGSQSYCVAFAEGFKDTFSRSRVNSGGQDIWVSGKPLSAYPQSVTVRADGYVWTLKPHEVKEKEPKKEKKHEPAQ